MERPTRAPKDSLAVSAAVRITETSRLEPRADAPAPMNPGRLVVWVGNNAQAETLVRHAGQVAAALSLPWTAICVDTPAMVQRPTRQRAHALQALQLAERLGASTDNISADSVLGAIVDRVKRERASMLMLGGHPADGWLDGERRHWLGGLAEALSARLPGVTVNVIHAPADGAPAAALPEPLSEYRVVPRQGWLRALGVVALCTLISEVFLPYLELASVATVYLAGVVFVAFRLGESAALLAVVVSILAFDLLVVEPRWSFTPLDPQYYFTFLVMLAVGMLVSRLAAHARLQAQLADARARRAQALNELARHLVSAQSGDDIAAGLEAALHATFDVPSALLLPDGQGQLCDPAGFCKATGAQDGLRSAQQAFDAGQRGAAADHSSDSSDRMLCLPLQGAHGALGVLLVRPLPDRFGTPEDRGLLNAFANQAALALGRALYERKSAQAVVEAETERLRSTLLSGISHDFRTPLTTIIGSATSLLQQDRALDPAHRTALLESVLGEAQRMHATMSDLLDLTRMEEGHVQPDCEWCPADDLIQEVRDALGARLARHRLQVQVPPDAIVWCDPRLLQQLLLNLLDNALRHTPPGACIEVRVEAEASAWRMSVADNGPGLPAGQENEVFKKFFRGQHEPADGGTGLGLAICAAVARQSFPIQV